MTAYVLTLAVFIPVSGWFADRFGARRIFALALLIFTAMLYMSLPALIGSVIGPLLGGFSQDAQVNISDGAFNGIRNVLFGRIDSTQRLGRSIAHQVGAADSHYPRMSGIRRSRTSASAARSRNVYRLRISRACLTASR